MLSRTYVARARALVRERTVCKFTRASSKPRLVLEVNEALLDALLGDGPPLVCLDSGFVGHADMMDIATQFVALLMDAEPRLGTSTDALVDREMGKRVRLDPPTRILVLALGAKRATKMHHDALKSHGVRACTPACTTHPAVVHANDACAPVRVLPLHALPTLELPLRLDEWLVVCCGAQHLEQSQLSTLLLMRSRGARVALLERSLDEPAISLAMLASVSVDVPLI